MLLRIVPFCSFRLLLKSLRRDSQFVYLIAVFESIVVSYKGLDYAFHFVLIGERLLRGWHFGQDSACRLILHCSLVTRYFFKIVA